jgi:D-beta-D-heptose 7-phosphate kinase/D-beta-D-heptose 1-phosphate adenosyltransferase
MTLPPLEAGRARDIVARIAGVHVLVVGDVMLDRFLVGHVTRISPEAPVPVVRFLSEHTRLGGAANVAHNLAALGADVSLIGLIGADAAASRLKTDLSAAGVPTDGLVVTSRRPTVEKVRIVTDRKQQVARIDYEEDGDVDDETARHLVDRIHLLGRRAKVALASDYLKGVIAPSVMSALLELKVAGTPLLVDPKIPHLASYAGASLVTPNQHEAETATHRRIRTDEDARAAAREFRARARCDAALLTRGAQGMWLSSPDGEGAIAAAAREVADVTGAGDTVVATLAMALGAGATLPEAAVLANAAAGIVVGKFGPATVTREELLAHLS